MRRSLEQNALMWSRLTDLANQLEWPVDGRMQKISPEDWKDVLTAGLKKSQRVAQGAEGGCVILCSHASRMTVGEMKEVRDVVEYIGANHNIQWSIADE